MTTNTKRAYKLRILRFVWAISLAFFFFNSLSGVLHSEFFIWPIHRCCCGRSTSWGEIWVSKFQRELMALNFLLLLR